MNKKQYNNIVENTLKSVASEEKDDSLSTARAIFKNMGVALPQGNIKEVFETVKTGNYMGWRSCTMKEAQEAANNGTAAIGISENKIVVISANDEEQPVEQTARVMAIDESIPALVVDGLQYYLYGGGTAVYGCGGVYRQVNDYQINCLEYALLFDEDAGIGLRTYLWDPELNSAYFIERIINKINSTINGNTSFICRSINSYNDVINVDEYRIAARVPHDDVYNYHFIYQLSDGTWAGKDDTSFSRHFGQGNPSVSPEMWNNDAYSPVAGTIYFAVKRVFE